MNSKIPEGAINEKWNNYKAKAQLVNPAHRKKLNVIVVGTGLVDVVHPVAVFCFHPGQQGRLKIQHLGDFNVLQIAFVGGVQRQAHFRY